MKHTVFILLAAVALTSCETTGEPTQGGLIGWSQGKANQRLFAREEHLADLGNENAYQRGRTAELEAQAAQKELPVKNY